jgi:hypothetical protein
MPVISVMQMQISGGGFALVASTLFTLAEKTYLLFD